LLLRLEDGKKLLLLPLLLKKKGFLGVFGGLYWLRKGGFNHRLRLEGSIKKTIRRSTVKPCISNKPHTAFFLPSSYDDILTLIPYTTFLTNQPPTIHPTIRGRKAVVYSVMYYRVEDNNIPLYYGGLGVLET